MRDVYRAVDDAIGQIVDGVDADIVVVFSMGGMGTNGSDVPAMVLLPELLSRWSIGRSLLSPNGFAPGEVPLIPPTETWSHAIRHQYPSEVLPTAPTLAQRVRNKLVRTVQRTRPFTLELGWMPAAWYRSEWSRQKAFALPSFYDGRVRVNVAGREARGLVPLDDYDAVLDELEALLRAVRDPRTGEPVVDTITRLEDPMAARDNDADLVVVWRGSALAFEHPDFGVLGPAPYRRVGGHTGPFGFAWVSGAGVEPVDLGVRSAYDVVPTIVDLAGEAPLVDIAGESMLPAMSTR